MRILGAEEFSGTRTNLTIPLGPFISTRPLAPNKFVPIGIENYFSVSDCYLDCPYFVSAYVLLVNAFRYEFDPDFVLINVRLQKIQYLNVELSKMVFPFFKLFGQSIERSVSFAISC